MDVSKYQFDCQKALHQGLQFAKSFGHRVLEVEHVAYALLRSEALDINAELKTRLISILQTNLLQMPKTFGETKIAFGKRLDAALDFAEAASPNQKVAAEIMWQGLQKQSTAIKLVTAKFHDDLRKQEQFEPMQTENVSEFSDSDNDLTQKNKPGDSDNHHYDKAAKKHSDILRKYTLDLSELAERGELDPVIGRDTELRRVLEILGRKKKNNPLLLGEPGVGKSAIAEALALRIAEKKVPHSMLHRRVLSLDLAALLAGSRYRGEFEERLKKLLTALKDLQGKIILFIDEIHMLVGAGSSEGSTDAANIMKPALARGEILALGATTLAEYKKFIETDSALDRRFQPIVVDEPSKVNAMSILRGLKSKYEIHHGVRVGDDALAAAIDLSIRYIPHRRLPDKAIDLMDEAASRLKLQMESVPAVIDDLKSKITQLEMEKSGLGKSSRNQKALQKIEAALFEVKKEFVAIETIWVSHQHALQSLKKLETEREELISLLTKAKQEGDFGFASQIQYDSLPKTESEITVLRKKLKSLHKQHNFLGREVGVREIAEVVSQWTSIPVYKLLKDDTQKLLAIEERLERRVFGQKEAVAKVARTIKRSRTGIGDPARPQGVFLFLGPTGVGKTELAKAIAAEIFDDETKIIRIDMSEYMEAHNVARLIGAPPGYVGFGEGGELTEAIKLKPHSVVLLDEMEKAHPRVLDILLQAFDEGRLTDAKGRLFDFKNAFFVMTSNLAIDVTPYSSDAEIRKSLVEYLRPELVNRIDEVVIFNRLAKKQMDLLVDRLTTELNQRLVDREFRITLSPAVKTKLIQVGQDSEFGGRALRRSFEMLVVDAVSDRLITKPELCQGVWLIDIGPESEMKWTEDFQLHRYLPPAR